MAHVFQKVDKLAAVALGLLRHEINLPNLFTNRYGIADFKGAKGDVVNVKRPAILKAQDAGFRSRNSIVFDDLIQSKIQVKLDRYPISPVALTDEELTLDIENFAQDVTAPQARALAEDWEGTVVKTLRDATYVHSVDYVGGEKADGAQDPRKVARHARKLLNSSDVPAGGRYWLVGADVAESIGNFDNLLDANTAGSAVTAIEGYVGRLAGFDIIESNALEGNESYFVHSSALALAFVAPVAPNGAKASATAVEGGISVRQLFDYDSDTLTDRSILGVFTGGTPVTDPKLKADGTIQMTGGNPVMQFVRAVKVTFTEAEPTEPPTGG